MIYGMLVRKQHDEPHLSAQFTRTDVVVAVLAVPGLLILAVLIGVLLGAL
jgi:hypothetical protein